MFYVHEKLKGQLRFIVVLGYISNRFIISVLSLFSPLVYKEGSDPLVREIFLFLFRLVLSLVTNTPQFIPHTVNLLNAVTSITPDR